MKEKLAAAKFSSATPVQAAAIPAALAGKDVLATAQTGTGKTLAFLVPAMEKLLKDKRQGIGALVLVPTRELAIQVAEQYNNLRGKQLPEPAIVVGGLSEHRQIESIRDGACLVVATPGRLEDFLERRLINFTHLHTLVLDEADRMLDIGFLPAIRRIAASLPQKRQTMFFSATLEASVAGLVKDYTRNPVRLELGSTLSPSENVKLQVLECGVAEKQDVLVLLLAKEHGRSLVFARTKRGADRIAKRLSQSGIQAAVIHGDRSQSQRNAALAGFQQGRFRVLVATDVAARGIHVEEVTHVINYDLPELAENFIHRVGRTGRAGRRGLASTLVAPEQRAELFELESMLGVQIEKFRPASIARLDEVERRNISSLVGSATRATRRSVQLPGEILQIQMAG